MKPEDQIKALAELDGWTWNDHAKCLVDPFGRCFGFLHPLVPKYLTSYDAIIPLIQKQPFAIHVEVCFNQPNKSVLYATPKQLSKALLRATGKWVDE